MTRRHSPWPTWLSLLTALWISTLPSEAWGQTPPPSVELTLGTPAPFPGVLLARGRVALILAAQMDLRQANLDLTACRARAVSGPMEVARSTPPCPEPPPERSPWPDRAIGAVGGSVGTALFFLALLLFFAPG